MDKNLYIAITITKNGKHYSYVLKTSAVNNLVSVLNIPDIVTANVCDTRKQAREIVEYWNKTYKQNNTYLFDETF